MVRPSSAPGPLPVLAAILLVALAAAPAAVADDRSGVRAGIEAPKAPKAPIGATAPAGTDEGSGRVASRPRSLLAGRPNQRLRVRVRLPARLRPGSELSLELRSVAREDPRHAGQRTRARSVARVPARVVAAGRARFRMRGLNPAPGPHRLIVRSDGARLAARRIEVLPQTREVVADRARRPRPLLAAPSPSPSPRSLAAGELNHDLSFRPGSEAGTAVAVETDDPARGIAVTGDGEGPPIAFISSAGFAAGSVAERRLQERVLLPGGSEASVELCCEGAAAADDAGNLWMAATSITGGGRIVVGRAPASASGFTGLPAALPRAAASVAQAQPALAAAGNRIAAAWVETLAGVQNVVVSQCDLAAGSASCDLGSAWSAPVPVTPVSGLYAMPSLAIAPGGDLHVAWWDAGPPPGGNRIAAASCRAEESCELAAAWDETATLARLDLEDEGPGGPDALPLFCPIIAAPGGLVNPSPTIAVGPGGEIHAAWSDLRDNADPDDPTRCTGSGSDKTFDSFVATGPAPGVMPASDSGVRLSADGPLDLNDHFLPALSVDQGTGAVEATFYSTADDPGGQRTSRDYVASVDGGASFSEPVELSTEDSRLNGPLSDGVDYGSRQGGDSAGGVHRPAWTDARPLQGRDPDLYVLSPPVQTTITSAPPPQTSSPVSTIRFETPAPLAVCQLDGGPFRPCTSPRTVGPTGNGRKRLRVTAVDRAGNWMDPDPASTAWNVADLDPPETLITVEPRRRTRSKRPRYEFTSDEPWAKFQCRYDKDVWRICLSPKTQKVSIGRHRVRIRAFDLAGNVDPTPYEDEVRRIKRCGKRKKNQGRC